MTSLGISNIALCGSSSHEGRIEFTPEAVTWHSKNSDKRINLPAKTIKAANWYDVGRTCQVWLYENATAAGGNLQRFEGFKGSDYDRLAAHLQAVYGVKLRKDELGVTGRNFVGLRVRDGQLELVDNEGGLVAPVPLTGIGMAALPGKSEVEVQMADDDTAEKEDEVLVEMRFFVPAEMEVEGARKKGSSSAAAGADEEGEEDGEDGDEDAATAVHRLITAGAGITSVTGDALAELPEDVGSFLVPRGRFAIELYPSFMRLAGASYEYKVQYKSIGRITYLPLPSPSGTWETATRYAIVISLDDPLRQGAQRYPHLVLQLEKKQYEVALRIPEEDRKAGRYEGLGADGTAAVSGDLPKLVGRLLKSIAGKPVFKPESFESATRQRAVRCNHKSNAGFLFPLDKSMMFIHKPTTWIRYADVESIEFARYAGGGAGAARTFDLHVKCRAGAGEAARELVFQSLDRAERDPLVTFFEARKLKVTQEDLGNARTGGKVNYKEMEEGEGLEDEDEEDEDYGGGGGDDDSDEDEEDEDEDAGEEEDDDDAAFSRKRKAGGKPKGKGSDKGRSKKARKEEPKKSKSKSKSSSKSKASSSKGKKKRKGSDSESDEESAASDSDSE